jgi:DNA-binding winged helix-turn-helix (wHTH) protein
MNIVEVSHMYVDTVSVVSGSKFIDINGKSVIDYEKEMSLDCCMNKIHFHTQKLTIDINEKQKRLVMCLFNDVNRKQDIIKVVWYENHKFRVHLKNAGIPDGIIKTINRYGLRLDSGILRTAISNNTNERFTGYV